MNPLLRSSLAVLAGLVVCAGLIFCVQWLAVLVNPLPADLNLRDPDVMNEWLQTAPVRSLIPVLLSYAIGTLGGSWLAGLLSGRAPVLHGLLVGVFFLGVSVVNLRRFSHPTWFTIACVSLFLPVAWLGGWLAPDRPAPTEPSPKSESPSAVGQNPTPPLA
jgi:hypothetical protein